MRAPEAQTRVPPERGAAVALPLRLLLCFSDAAYEVRFVQHYVAFYFRYAQASLLLGMLLIAGDYAVRPHRPCRRAGQPPALDPGRAGVAGRPRLLAAAEGAQAWAAGDGQLHRRGGTVPVRHLGAHGR
jgi:hypothetical protein